MLFLSFLGQLVVQLPVLAALVVGIVLSVANRARFGRAANLALAGFVILLIEYVTGTALSLFVPYFYSTLDIPVSQVGIIFGVIAFVRSVAAAIAFGCLIAALFRAR